MPKQLLALASLLALWAAGAQAAPAVQVSLAALTAQDTLRAVQITLRFQGEADGETLLRLPNEWGGEVELWKCIRNLTVEGTDAHLDDGPDAWHRVLRHAPAAQLTVRYEVFQDWVGVPQANGKNQYRPILQPGYFQLIGDAVFALPAWDEQTKAQFMGAALPAGWTFASDLEHARRGHPLTLGDVTESVAVGGDFRVLTAPDSGGRLRVALRGRWQFSDEALTAKIARIVRSHLRFFGDPDEPFLVTVLPLQGEAGHSSLGGTGRTDAFAFFSTDNAEEATLNRLLAHEHLHTWIPRRLGRMPEQDEAADYWLSEGFTDFYAFRLLVADGLWSVQDFVDATNEVLQRYAESPARTAPNAQIVKDFWNDPDVQNLPYQRGFLLAMVWDERLRRASHGRRDLDDVLLAMNRTWKRTNAHGQAPLASEQFVRAMRAAKLDPTQELDAHVTRGEPIELPADLLGELARIETLQRPQFERGFDAQATQQAQGLVTGVDPDGPAHAAGLRDGMKILAREAGKPGDSSVELVYRVLDGGTEQRIRYRPEGKRTFVLQQIVRLDQAGGPQATKRLARRLSGR